MYRVVAIIIFLGLFTSCNKEVQECYTPTNVPLIVGFRVIDTMVAVDSLNRPDTTVAFRDTALYFPVFQTKVKDTIYSFIGDRASTAMAVFLNPDTNFMQYILQPNQDIAIFDTLNIRYEHKEHFISNDCGYTYFYDIKQIYGGGKRVLLDSFEVTNAEVSTSQKRNISVYFTD
ncbi:MAG TPA: DUF6452 family protein [Edaphocola sp.]|nr:DUF6452 family protein [Edaphocola sp.]